MDARLLRPARSICLLCRVARKAQSGTQWPRAIGGSLDRDKTPLTKQRRHASSRASAQPLGKTRDHSQASQSQHKIRRLSSQDHSQVQDLADRVLKHPGIPTEANTLDALTHIDLLARQLLGLEQDTKTSIAPDSTPASTLLSLDSQPTAPPTGKAPPTENITFLTDTAYKLISHDLVYITPAILTLYVQIQALLSRPSTLPHVFTLYRTKPTAYLTNPTSPTTSQTKIISYRPQNPTAISTAIPTQLADLALSTALQTKHLTTALDIISTTHRDRSNIRSKLFRRAFPPIAFFSLFPIACWQAAKQASLLQNMVPEEDFVVYATALLTTYITSLSILGYTALTTRNDQMQRVTWVLGTPLYQRWLREEERAATERLAMAWGHKERWRWGEEEGAEWRLIKEWAGVRGMVVDRVGLMEGME